MDYAAYQRWPEQPRGDIIAAKREISRVFADIDPHVQRYVAIADVVEQLRAREHTRAAAHWAIFELERDGLIQRCFIEGVEHIEQKRDLWPIDFGVLTPDGDPSKAPQIGEYVTRQWIAKRSGIPADTLRGPKWSKILGPPDKSEKGKAALWKKSRAWDFIANHGRIG